MLDKSNSTEEVGQITFNWERVKKKATSKREELVSNAPNVVKRATIEANVNTSSKPGKSPATSTTDTLTDPYTSIAIQTKHSISTPSSSTPSSPPVPIQPIGTEQEQPPQPPKQEQPQQEHPLPNGIQSNGTQRPRDTQRPRLLADASPQDSMTLSACESIPGPDKNAVALLQAIKSKETTGKELTMDERRLVVKSMRELGQTQDAIAELLQVSRRTVVNDYRALRQEQALAIQKTDTTEIAGEVYATARVCIRRALQAGSFKTVSTVMRDMVEVLQSLGVLYRAPKTSMQANLHGDIPGRSAGYQKYMDGIAGDKNKVVEVLDCMFDAIGQDKVCD